MYSTNIYGVLIVRVGTQVNCTKSCLCHTGAPGVDRVERTHEHLLWDQHVELYPPNIVADRTFTSRIHAMSILQLEVPLNP